MPIRYGLLRSELVQWDMLLDQACLCTQCLTIIHDEDARWMCDCEDINTIYGCLSEDELPDRWIKGRIAFFPVKS